MQIRYIWVDVHSFTLVNSIDSPTLWRFVSRGRDKNKRDGHYNSGFEYHEVDAPDRLGAMLAAHEFMQQKVDKWTKDMAEGKKAKKYSYVLLPLFHTPSTIQARPTRGEQDAA